MWLFELWDLVDSFVESVFWFYYTRCLCFRWIFWNIASVVSLEQFIRTNWYKLISQLTWIPTCWVHESSCFEFGQFSLSIIRIPIAHQVINLLMSTHINDLLTWLINFISIKIISINIKHFPVVHHTWQSFSTWICL